MRNPTTGEFLENQIAVGNATTKLALDMAGQGISDDEISYGLSRAIMSFAFAVKDRDFRYYFSEMLHDLAKDLVAGDKEEMRPDQLMRESS